MAQRAAALALSLVGERKVVVRIGVVGNERDGALVGAERIRKALHLVEDVAQVDEGEGILGIGLGGATVELLGLCELAQVVVNGA